MTDEMKEKECKCCLGLGVVVLVLGILSGVIGGGGFGLPHVLAIVVGAVLILAGFKKSKFCKCCKTEKPED